MNTEQTAPLDDAARVQSVDRRNMLRLISELPEQFETGLGVGRSFRLQELTNPPNVVYITGVGASAAAGDMAAALVAEESSVPVISDHGSRLPAYIGESSLVVILDYTGKSFSAIRNCKEARARGANVVCITSGGKLGETASSDGATLLKVPPAQAPRSAVGYMFVPVVSVFERFGLVQGLDEQISYGIKLMKNVREIFRFENSTARNPAKQMAQQLYGKVPVIYGSPGYRTIVANRWKSQCNANAKLPAFAGVLSDLAAGEISGWEDPNVKKYGVFFVLLRDPADKATEVAKQTQAVRDLLEQFGVLEVDIKGSTTAEKLLYGIYLGDYVSYYLALLHGVNPSINENVAYIQSQFEE